MLLKSNVENLKKLVKKENVLTSPEERYCYAEDSTNREAVSALPDAVIFAESIEEVQRVLRYANEKKIPVKFNPE